MAVDIHSRAILAEALEAYLNCRTDSYALHTTFLDAEKNDTACYELYVAMVGIFYEFDCCHQNAGNKVLAPRAYAMVSRWIRFLRSQEEWPLPSRFGASWLRRELGEAYDSLRHKTVSDKEYWPFETADDWRRFE